MACFEGWGRDCNEGGKPEKGLGCNKRHSIFFKCLYKLFCQSLHNGTWFGEPVKEVVVYQSTGPPLLLFLSFAETAATLALPLHTSVMTVLGQAAQIQSPQPSSCPATEPSEQGLHYFMTPPGGAVTLYFLSLLIGQLCLN